MLLSEAFHRIETALNGQGAYDPRTVLGNTGRYFFACRPWRFSRRMTGYASLGANRAYLTLPLGCMRVISIERDQSVTGNIQIVDPATFNLMRTLYVPDTVNYWATEDIAPDVDGVLTRRLALHRAPDETVARAFLITFEAGWADPTKEQMSQADLALPLVDYAEPLFGEMLEAIAVGMDQPEKGSVSDRLGAVLQGPMFAAAVAADTRAVPDVGPAMNTAVQMARRSGAWEPDPTITLTAP